MVVAPTFRKVSGVIGFRKILGMFWVCEVILTNPLTRVVNAIYDLLSGDHINKKPFRLQDLLMEALMGP